jgi:hypothetical protein
MVWLPWTPAEALVNPEPEGARAMTATSLDRDPIEETWESSTVRLAQAYCGPAHGRRWPLNDGDPPPSEVVLKVAAQVVTYRLVRHPRSHRPAYDQRGHLLYMPLLYAP